MEELILDRKVKYKDERYSAGEPVPVEDKDVSYFQERDMIVRVASGNDAVLLDEKDKKIKELNEKIDEIKDHHKQEIQQYHEENLELKERIKELESNNDFDFDDRVAPEDEVLVEGGVGPENESKAEKEDPLEDKLTDMSVKELYTIAQDLEIEGRSKLRNNRDKLIAAIKEKLSPEEAGE